MESALNLPWTEKYRPNIDDIIGHQTKIATLKSLIKNNELTHLLFYGPSGTGKTSTILACAKEMYGLQYKKYIMELNASDDRGIETVRNHIPTFASRSLNKTKLIILDEADAMTQDAQKALRRVMEDFSKTTRFCLICNDINKIIPGLISRCSKMNFGNLQTDQIKIRVSQIIQNENIKIDDLAIDKLISITNDLRQILNTLQCLHSLNQSIITENDINKYLCIPDETEIIKLITNIQKLQFPKAIEYATNLYLDNKWTLKHLINKISKYILKSNNYNDKQKIFIIKRLSNIDSKIVYSDSEIQLWDLVTIFKEMN